MSEDAAVPVMRGVPPISGARFDHRRRRRSIDPSPSRRCRQPGPRTPRSLRIARRANPGHSAH